MTPGHLRAMLRRLRNILGSRLPVLDSDIHGRTHLEEVALLAGQIAEDTGVDVESAMVAGLLHDAARVHDGVGSQHAHDSADLAERLLPEVMEYLPVERISQAIRRHADGLVADDPLAGALWDADRLTLPRCGIEVRPDLLSTPAGQALLRRRQAAGD